VIEKERALRRYQRLALIGGFLLWAGSLALPAVEVSGGPTLSGSDVLMQGHTAWRQGVPSWFSNPLLAIAILGAWAGFHRASSAAATIAFGLALSSLFAGGLARSRGATVPEFGYLAGFYVWLLAHAVVLVAAVWGVIVHRNAAQS
jgi:hypothetical protein